MSVPSKRSRPSALELPASSLGRRRQFELVAFSDDDAADEAEVASHKFGPEWNASAGRQAHRFDCERPT